MSDGGFALNFPISIALGCLGWLSYQNLTKNTYAKYQDVGTHISALKSIEEISLSQAQTALK